jgi:hypothetical protein
MTTETQRDAIAHRIRALLAKTVENGCTEEEAITAAQKARDLMDHYRLSMSDVEIQAEPIERIDLDRDYKTQVHPADYCMPGIAKYCGVKMWYSTDDTRVRRLTVFGLKSDVQMARYLYDLIVVCLKSEVHSFIRTVKGSDGTRTKRAVASFTVGMCGRLNQRLVEMASALDSTAQTGSGTALVVVKNAVVTAAFAKLGLKFRGSLSGKSVRDVGAYMAGRAAGDRVNLNRPVAGGKPSGYLK